MVVARADETTIVAVRVGIGGEVVRHSDEIPAQILTHHEIKGGVQRGRQYVIIDRADHVLLVAAEVCHGDVPVVVGIALFVRTEKKEIEQLLALRVQRIKPCLQPLDIACHFLVAQIVTDHRIPPSGLPHGTMIKVTDKRKCSTPKQTLVEQAA